jgi:hypothetical protein
VPWFPNTDYLIQAVAARLMQIANDDRMPTFFQLADDTLMRYLKMFGAVATALFIAQ